MIYENLKKFLQNKMASVALQNEWSIMENGAMYQNLRGKQIVGDPWDTLYFNFKKHLIWFALCG